ncbi:hypothetical protein GSI_04947 [Ganoderma sinense ZZ0214-1]|uniref:Cytochrome P450 n=1 Tax=Ganoderma sinense ZZ0214-1 TaxID=1077348 RepID=A0A2G8SGC8_9APHY|nr:hypothetical protein GSI_04947 [Ganoderma sinense ZZ0214-1]
MCQLVTASAYLGSSDTAHALLEAFCLAMAMHPDKQKKAPEELNAVIGPHRLPDFSDRDALPYTRAILKEEMRWHIIAPIRFIHLTMDDDKYNGYFLPARTILNTNIWLVQLREGYPDRESFRLERLLEDGPPSDPADYVFGFGPRLCPGRHFSIASSFITFTSVLRIFDIQPPPTSIWDPNQHGKEAIRTSSKPYLAKLIGLRPALGCNLKMSRQFPNELFDAIISCVPTGHTGWLWPKERETLLNCTLVCRDWLPVSRHTLFSYVHLKRPTAWDSFLRSVVNAEEGRPWLASILRLQVEDGWYSHYEGDKKIPAKPVSEWRGQYVIPVLAGHLPNLELLSLSVDWDRCQPHATTFGMFSQFTSLRELRLDSCRFPSFCTFRRILVSLPALKTLRCSAVHWPSAPQPSILAIPSGHLALQSLGISLLCDSFHDLSLQCGPVDFHPITLPHRTLDYYVQIFAPSVQVAAFGNIQSMHDIANTISDLSRFGNLRSLDFAVNGTDWGDAADLLQSLPARLDTLIIFVDYGRELVDRDMMVKEDGEVKAMKTNGLELLEPVLLRDNFKALHHLEFKPWGYRDTLEPLEESIIQTIWRKLPKLHSRTTLNIRLAPVYINRSPPPSRRPSPSPAVEIISGGFIP